MHGVIPSILHTFCRVVLNLARGTLSIFIGCVKYKRKKLFYSLIYMPTLTKIVSSNKGRN